jgi:EmrB/QacA subfamily drug resistance transporter
MTSRSPSLLALLVLMCTALALVIGANSSLSVALPDVAADLGASQTELSYIVNVYALVFAALLLPVGLAADRYGRRPFLVAGLLVFGGASLASAFAPDPTTLILLRGLAGTGAAAVMPATLSVLVDAYPPERRAFAVSIWAGVSGAGAMLGVLLSGVLLELFWWGSVQLTYGVAAAAVAAAAVLVVPASRNPSLAVDLWGGLLSLVGLSGLVLGVLEGPERGWTHPVTLVALALGAAGLIAFVSYELVADEPMLDVRLFRSRGLSAGSALVFLQFFSAFGFFFLAPQFLQFVQGHDALGAALRLLPLIGGIAPASVLGPRLLGRYGSRVIGSAGMTVMAGSFVLFGVVADGPYWQFAAALVLLGLGFGTAITPGTQLIIDGLPADRRTLSAAVNDVTREVGGALGGAVAASVLVAVYGRDLVTTGLPAQAAEQAEDGVAAAIGIAERLGPQGAALADSAREAFTAGYQAAVFAAAAALVLGAVVAALVAPSRADEAAAADVTEPYPAEPNAGRAASTTGAAR